MKQGILLGFFLFAFGLCTQGQTLSFEAVFGEKPLVLGTTYTTNSGVIVEIETLRFYITQLQLKQDGKTIWTEENSYHLIDINNSSSLQLSIPDSVEFDEVSFLLGTDSLTNVSGAMGGDLDPTKGMYWAWNSGYINFKLEGTSPVCDTRNNRFTFHLGGYAYPNATVQTVTLAATGSAIIFDVKAFLEGIDLKETNSIMSPSTTAVALSKKASALFKMKNAK